VQRATPTDRGIDDLTAAIINFNTAPLTGRAVRSLLDAGVRRVLVLDNGSAAEDLRRLESEPFDPADAVRIVRSEENLGFAAGSNRLIELALADASCDRVLLLNSDAIVDARGLAACLARMDREACDLMGGRMLKLGPAGEDDDVDSLGIALYRSLLASNRKSTTDRYLGPTGGFAILRRAFLEEVVRVHGHVFDPAYFCYAEDSDLCLRARLLGASVGYCDEVAARHAGQASTTGGYSDFILYHGIRNSIWMVAKSMPGALVVLHLPWIVALHAGIVLRHVAQGHARTLLRLYVDAAKGLPAVLRARRKVQASRRVRLAELRSHIDPRFYEKRYVKTALVELFRRSA
jgi:GT2 family glycosyltransferase